VRRREFITLLGGAASWPLTARAQQPDRMRRIGVVMPAASDNQRYQAYLAAFLQGLQQLGWTDGRNVMPLGQSQDIPRAGPGGRVSPRF
jgi:putative ABC transport system substrate-binding protein